MQRLELCMPGVNLDCPHCGQRIINAMAGAENRLTCGACGEGIDLAPDAKASSGRLPVAISREPARASYGLLIICGWAFMACLLVLDAVEAHRFAREFAKYLPSYRNREVIQLLLQIFSHLLMGLAIVLIAAKIAVIDRAAAMLAHRRASFAEALLEPRGSNLVYILPFGVA